MKNDTYMGLVEMMHRLLTIAQLLIKSVPDHFTAQMKEGTLTIKHFFDLVVMGPKANPPP